MSKLDQQFLDHAIRIARRGLGRTGLNPSVGCVLVKNDQVIAVARSADGGRPHAETQALQQAGKHTRGATAYVSLEPCAHHGGTPPCAQALIDAGIDRVVLAAIVADPRVSGNGVNMLQAAGIEVVEAITQSAVRDLRGFFRRTNHRLPYVAMKLATSLDGKIADSAGASQWITGDAARAHAHGLRGTFDAILTGIGTVIADDPQLTVRLPGLQHDHTIRIVADRQLRLPLTSKLVRSATMQPVWVITSAQAVEQAASHATELREAGVVLHVIEDTELAPHNILQALGKAGVMRLLIEAGSGVSTAFLAANCVDTLHWYRAPILLGNTGQAAVGALETSLSNAARAVPVRSMLLGPDRCDQYELTSCLPD